MGLLVEVGLVLAEELELVGERFLEVVLLLLGFVGELLEFEGDATVKTLDEFELVVEGVCILIKNLTNDMNILETVLHVGHLRQP